MDPMTKRRSPPQHTVMCDSPFALEDFRMPKKSYAAFDQDKTKVQVWGSKCLKIAVDRPLRTTKRHSRNEGPKLQDSRVIPKPD